MNNTENKKTYVTSYHNAYELKPGEVETYESELKRFKQARPNVKIIHFSWVPELRNGFAEYYMED